MKDFLLDETGDIVLTNDLTYLTGPEEIAQSVRVILTTRLNEFELERELGLEQSNLLGKRLNIDYLIQDITDAILSQETRITSLKNLEINKLDNRKLEIKIEMIAENTDIEIEVIV